VGWARATAQQKPTTLGLLFRLVVPPALLRLRRLSQARHFSHGCGLVVGAPGVGEVDGKARRLFRYGLPSLSLRYPSLVSRAP
jgi:hypothetical protein